MVETIKLDDIKQIALNAGEAIMEIYAHDFDVQYKADASPLTEADLAANELICNALQNLHPNIPILSEENKAIAYEKRAQWECFWCIDPIDGTKEFIKKNGQFTVNIALVCAGMPVLGVVYAPALGELYSAKHGEGAFKEIVDAHHVAQTKVKLPLPLEIPYEETLHVVASKSHMSAETQAFVDTLQETTEELVLVSKGSSLKLCMVAEGAAAVYPRLAPTMEWDTAAAHAVVKEAGKEVYMYQPTLSPKDYLASPASLKPLQYNKPELLNPYFVVV